MLGGPDLRAKPMSAACLLEHNLFVVVPVFLGSSFYVLELAAAAMEREVVFYFSGKQYCPARLV